LGAATAVAWAMAIVSFCVGAAMGHLLVRAVDLADWPPSWTGACIFLLAVPLMPIVLSAVLVHGKLVTETGVFLAAWLAPIWIAFWSYGATRLLVDAPPLAALRLSLAMAWWMTLAIPAHVVLPSLGAILFTPHSVPMLESMAALFAVVASASATDALLSLFLSRHREPVTAAGSDRRAENRHNWVGVARAATLTVFLVGFTRSRFGAAPTPMHPLGIAALVLGAVEFASLAVFASAIGGLAAVLADQWSDRFSGARWAVMAISALWFGGLAPMLTPGLGIGTPFVLPASAISYLRALCGFAALGCCLGPSLRVWAELPWSGVATTLVAVTSAVALLSPAVPLEAGNLDSYGAIPLPAPWGDIVFAAGLLLLMTLLFTAAGRISAAAHRVASTKVTNGHD
jgi:hypothetical protein